MGAWFACGMKIRHEYSPYLVHAHFTTHLHIYQQNIETQLVPIGWSSRMSIPAGTARGMRFRLHMVSSRIRLATNITWICAVSCSHTHLHVPSTLLIHDLHTSRVGWLELENAHASWHSTGRRCRLHMVSSRIRLATNIT